MNLVHYLTHLNQLPVPLVVKGSHFDNFIHLSRLPFTNVWKYTMADLCSHNILGLTLCFTTCRYKIIHYQVCKVNCKLQ